jgi:hypothetical protein
MNALDGNVWTGLRDQNGVRINIGDRVRFHHYDGCVWDGTVTFEDGVATIDVTNAAQVTNPKSWDQMHDWIKSRWWSTMVGYGEYGAWNCPRRPLTQIADNWRDYDVELQPLYEKHGFGAGRIIKAEVICHIPKDESKGDRT